MAGLREFRTVRLWDRATGACTAVFHGHQDAVTCVAVSHDGAFVAATGLDGSMTVHDEAGRRPVAVMRGDGQLFSCAWGRVTRSRWAAARGCTPSPSVPDVPEGRATGTAVGAGRSGGQAIQKKTAVIRLSSRVLPQ
ncbi:hypothetical protein [Kitasatospora sp. NPDC085879]|uniref:hypothetical protein n=1 Tax=Kitasatospora sp. NPDC085879 TaxID=3154769 RepID=UPI00344436EA